MFVILIFFLLINEVIIFVKFIGIIVFGIIFIVVNKWFIKKVLLLIIWYCFFLYFFVFKNVLGFWKLLWYVFGFDGLFLIIGVIILLFDKEGLFCIVIIFIGFLICFFIVFLVFFLIIIGLNLFCVFKFLDIFFICCVFKLLLIFI